MPTGDAGMLSFREGGPEISARSLTARVALALALLVASLAVPASASALSLMVEDLGPPGSAINARSYDTSRYMGARYERRIVNVTSWKSGVINGGFNWEGQAGPYVDGAIANGLKPYLTITADPGWSSAESRIPSAAKFKTVCGEAAATFSGRVYDYAVWNEPNLTHVGNLSPSDYLNLYKACREGIKSVSASANVYFGEFSTAASGWGGMNACEYFRATTPVNANLVTEGVAIHPYQFSSSPKTKTGTECNGIGRLGDWEIESTGAKTANALKSASGSSAPIVISEFGYCGERPPYALGYPAGAAQPACPQNAGGTANVKDEATRAAWVKEAFEWASLFAKVTIFDYHTVVKRPAGNYVGNTGYLWESGIINSEDGSWTPSVASLRAAVKPASKAPEVATNAASAIAATGATLSGSVAPEGLSTGYRFEYGPTSSYGSTTPWVDVGWAGGAVARSAVVTGLQSGVTYHYRIAATNVAGTKVGSDATFTTFSIDTLGVFNSAAGAWCLSNRTTSGTGVCDLYENLGGSVDRPVAGDWNGDGIDTLGVFNPTVGQWCLSNRTTSGTGSCDLYESLGGSADQAIAGDWNGDGIDTLGVFNSAAGAWCLSNRTTSGTGVCDLYENLGSSVDRPVAGDWNS
jgi:hypothetical protein